MRLIKALLGGILSFFGILLGGLLENITGAFRSEDSQPIPAPLDVAASTAASSFSLPVSQPVASSSVAQPSQPISPFIPNSITAPPPNRRPGKTMTAFKLMARDLSLRQG
ncbi:MAG: hypothetical protein NW237_08305 [Cyanobacteriota bacterium]|nr:hypothetical protein [Cyanobacteriota bacterium]